MFLNVWETISAPLVRIGEKNQKNTADTERSILRGSRASAKDANIFTPWAAFCSNLIQITHIFHVRMQKSVH